jgi:predicted extracellular nuclease
LICCVDELVNDAPSLNCRLYEEEVAGTVLITEYVEGTSNNKALEITNRSSVSVDLWSCKLIKYTNGRGPGSQISFMGPSMRLAPGDSYTICNTQFFRDAGCNQTSNFIDHNGDDGYALDCDGIVDTFGATTGDPGTAWSGGGVTTRDRTLRCNCDVLTGDIDMMDAFDPSVQWTEFPRDTFDDLGSYVCP